MIFVRSSTVRAGNNHKTRTAACGSSVGPHPDWVSFILLNAQQVQDSTVPKPEPCTPPNNSLAGLQQLQSEVCFIGTFSCEDLNNHAPADFRKVTVRRPVKSGFQTATQRDLRGSEPPEVPSNVFWPSVQRLRSRRQVPDALRAQLKVPNILSPFPSCLEADDELLHFGANFSEFQHVQTSPLCSFSSFG